MNKTFEMVKAWAEFEDANPQGDIADFCRHYLAHHGNRKATSASAKTKGDDCKDYFELSRMVNELARLWTHHSTAAIRPHNLLNFDEFAFLYTVNVVSNIRKKDLIYMHFIEISSGLLIIDRLLQKELLKEAVDKADKRSRRLAITKKGAKTLAQASASIEGVAIDMYGAMPENDLLLCIKLLKPTLSANAERWHQHKGFEPPLP